MIAIALENLTLGYERRPAVHHLSGAFAPGQVSAIVGPNGSGKSTLLKGLAGALRPLSGSIERGGLGPRDIAYLPQDSGLSPGFPITLEALAALGLWGRRGMFGRIGDDDRARIGAAFAAVGLSGLEERSAGQVSGGQLQRALFARVLIQDAKLILLDEPFANLDERTAADLLAIVRRWPAEGRTVVVVSHDLSLVRALATETLVLARRKVAWGPTALALAPEHLAEAQSLSEAWADHAGVCHQDDHAHTDHAA